MGGKELIDKHLTFRTVSVWQHFQNRITIFPTSYFIIAPYSNILFTLVIIIYSISQHRSYDYIITGAGCAGLSLLLRMKRHPFFAEKKILLIDADSKRNNDRTWCFWETKPGLFQDIVYKQWEQIDFHSQQFSARLDIAPYVYKMIRGGDLYQYVFSKIQSSVNITFLQERVQEIYNQNNQAYVQTSAGTYTAKYVFNSILFKPELLQAKGSLLQHFKGWMITTDEPKFNSSVATFMDFRLRTAEENTFVYVLPVAPGKALVEYTVFSSSLLPEQVYTDGLKQYISQYLQLPFYSVTEEEFGVIPMSNYTFAHSCIPVVNIGTAGGQTKGSSGYTFQFIQKHSDAVIKALIQQEHPGVQHSTFHKRFKLYDDTLLSILYHKKLSAEKVFSDLFINNKPQQLFKFLDNETTLAEELKIMSTVPAKVFLPFALQQLFN